jgi:SAM-dependent methyltransferase
VNQKDTHRPGYATRPMSGTPIEKPAVSDHYQGERGARYFGWQGSGGELEARIELAKFQGEVSPRDRVVDFGCGGGWLLGLLSCAERTGVEPNPPARAEGQRRGLRIVESSAELGDSSADVVISNHALEHTLAPWTELRELARVLRPGGRLLLWLPIDDWRRQRRPRAADVNHHLYTWTPQLLANLLAEAGFEVRQCRVVAHAWPRYHRVLFRLLPRRAFDVLARIWARLALRRQLHATAVKAQ